MYYLERASCHYYQIYYIFLQDSPPHQKPALQKKVSESEKKSWNEMRKKNKKNKST
jgi:hypothetical protein